MALVEFAVTKERFGTLPKGLKSILLKAEEKDGITWCRATTGALRACRNLKTRVRFEVKPHLNQNFKCFGGLGPVGVGSAGPIEAGTHNFKQAIVEVERFDRTNITQYIKIIGDNFQVLLETYTLVLAGKVSTKPEEPSSPQPAQLDKDQNPTDAAGNGEGQHVRH